MCVACRVRYTITFTQDTAIVSITAYFYLLGLSLVNLDGLLDALKTLGPKWYLLGTRLKLSETLLDETQTNIIADLQCLREILTNWLSYHEPSLEKLNDALAEMNQPTLLYDASNRGNPQLITNIVWHCAKLNAIISPQNLQCKMRLHRNFLLDVVYGASVLCSTDNQSLYQQCCASFVY